MTIQYQAKIYHYIISNSTNFNLNFEPSKVLTEEIETKKESEADCTYRINFIIPKENICLIIVQNLVSDGDMMELENKRNIPFEKKIGINIVLLLFLSLFQLD